MSKKLLALLPEAIHTSIKYWIKTLPEETTPQQMWLACKRADWLAQLLLWSFNEKVPSEVTRQMVACAIDIVTVATHIHDNVSPQRRLVPYVRQLPSNAQEAERRADSALWYLKYHGEDPNLSSKAARAARAVITASRAAAALKQKLGPYLIETPDFNAATSEAVYAVIEACYATKKTRRYYELANMFRRHFPECPIKEKEH